MSNDAWIDGFRNKITTTVQVQEFVALWIRLQDVGLQPEMQDTISWRWTSDSQYSTGSAYHIQFKGSYIKYNSNLIWKAHAVNKCTLFTWIQTQDKILTVDNLNLQGCPLQDVCILCMCLMSRTIRNRSPSVRTLPLCSSGLATSCNLGTLQCGATLTIKWMHNHHFLVGGNSERIPRRSAAQVPWYGNLYYVEHLERVKPTHIQKPLSNGPASGLGSEGWHGPM